MKNSTLVRSALLAASCGLSLLVSANADAQLTPVDVELSLLNDFSGSVDSENYNLQVQGYVNAFNDIDFTGTNFAVNFVAWSGPSQQLEVLPWTQITSNADAQGFANALQAALLPVVNRPFQGNTAPGSAINAALNGITAPDGSITVTGIFDNQFDGEQLVFDVSGDGIQNAGLNTGDERDNAEAAGVTINGLVIEPTSSLEFFYNNQVKTTDGFVVTAANFVDFGDAIEDKIESEVINGNGGTTVPEPSSLVALLGLGTLGAASKLKCNQKEA